MSLDINVITRVVAITVTFKIFEKGRVVFLPQQVALIGQGNTASTYATTPLLITGGASQVANAYGFGSPLHLAARQLFPDNGDGIGFVPVTVFPLEDDGAAVVATGAIGATGTTQTTDQVYSIKVNNISTGNFTIPATTVPDAALALMKTALDAILEMPTLHGTPAAGTMAVTSKWLGESANDIFIEIVGTESGLVFAVTQPIGGATNPVVTAATALFGDTWYTIIIDCLNYEDVTTLGLYSTFGDGRWGETVKAPLWVATGCTANLATRTAITDARKTDKTNALVGVAPGSRELPCVLAARGIARIAPVAASDPPNGYKGRLTGLTAGAVGNQENVTQRNTSLLLGSSNTIVIDNEIELNDTITMYHPTGETNPGFRYVVDIVKLQNIVFNLRIIFENDEWKGVPLLPDGTPTNSPSAKQPKNAVTVLGNLADNLGLAAIISDPDFVKTNLAVSISSQNPKRLDNDYPVKLSGNVEVIATNLFFGFFFGAA